MHVLELDMDYFPLYSPVFFSILHFRSPLSEGRINEAGLLECGYHGWTFSAGGECQTVPQAPAGSVGHRSARACVEAYPCAVRQGLIWVRPTPISKVMAAEGGGLGEEKIPTADEVREEDGWVFRTVVRDLPYDYATLLENVLDVSHVPFTHHGTVGNRANATAVDLEITQRSRDGFEGLWREGPRNGRYGPQLSRFRAPIMMEHSLNALDTLGFATKTVVYAVPQAPGRCRVIARIPWKFKSPIPRLVFALLPGWATHPNENLILEDDQLFLHQQERELAMLQQQNPGTGIGGLYYMPTSADAFVNAFRTWVAKTGGGGPFGRLSPEEFLRAIGPRQTEEQLLDRYHSHTKHCRSCSAALEFVERTQTVLRVLSPAMILVASLCAAAAAGATSAPAAAVALSLPLLGQVGMVAAPSLWTASGVLGAGGLVAWVVAMALERYRSSFLVGTYPPPRNYKK